MAPAPVRAEVRLRAKRAVRKTAKHLKKSLKQSSLDNEETWHLLEKSQTDDVSRICARQLLLLRSQLKDRLRSYVNGECSIEDLVLHTGLNRDVVDSILEKYTDDKEGGEFDNEDSARSSPSPGTTGNRSTNNVTFVVPKLDIADVRNDAETDESSTPQSARDRIEQIPQIPHMSQPSTPQRVLAQQDPAPILNWSPREVPDSSAEISDLAKKLGVRLFQDTSILEQLQSVKREKSFVEQLRELVASSSRRDPPAKPLQFIPSTPIASQAKPPVHSNIECKEIDVQTSWVGEPKKEMRDNATDLPSLDYLSTSELGGLRQLPETFVAQEEVSSSAFSSDQSAGQVPQSLIRFSQMRTTIPVDRDGSAFLAPAKGVKVSESMEYAPVNSKQITKQFDQAPEKVTENSTPRTPRVSESPWRPSSRRLHLEEVDISTSQDSNSIEVISVGTPRRLPLANPDDAQSGHKVIPAAEGTSAQISLKDSSDLSHQDEEHTYNQVSQIVSE
ncbi:unnamed protein product [Cylicocyclus nassatus]|uniref:Uncharacterized protein n=1 Tax=Cylicocyclus nassatus TaxID=53992 RepID=A0AA36DTZ7_CYLNA|nr:unnamed protein product [Cylicocyclus nassatus]